MARTYKRDSRGRFAGGGGGGSGGRKSVKLPAPARRTVGSKPQRRRGLLLQRGAVASSKRKLAAKDPADQSIKGTLFRRSQKGAVTRAQKQLKAAQQGGRVRLSGRGGVLRVGARKAEPAKAVSKKWRYGMDRARRVDARINANHERAHSEVRKLTGGKKLTKTANPQMVTAVRKAKRSLEVAFRASEFRSITAQKAKARRRTPSGARLEEMQKRAAAVMERSSRRSTPTKQRNSANMARRALGEYDWIKRKGERPGYSPPKPLARQMPLRGRRRR